MNILVHANTNRLTDNAIVNDMVSFFLHSFCMVTYIIFVFTNKQKMLVLNFIISYKAFLRDVYIWLQSGKFWLDYTKDHFEKKSQVMIQNNGPLSSSKSRNLIFSL